MEWMKARIDPFDLAPRSIPTAIITPTALSPSDHNAQIPVGKEM